MEDRSIWMKKMEGKSALGKEDCPFCKDEPELVIQIFEHWKFIYNKYPYNNEKQHTLLIPKRHIEHTKDLTKEELGELAKIEAYIENYYKGKDYFSFIRHTIAGKSIRHIHYHYLPGVLYSQTIEQLLQQQT